MDGTKIAADASLASNRERVDRREIAELMALTRKMSSTPGRPEALPGMEPVAEMLR